MPGTGVYTPYHLGDVDHTAVDQGANSYVGIFNHDHVAQGFFPLNSTEVEAMWVDKEGITCVEMFFYLSHLNQGQASFLADIRIKGTGGTAKKSLQVRVKVKSNKLSLKNKFYYVRSSNDSDTSSGEITLESALFPTDWIFDDEWYHWILRWNSGNTQWEWLLGRLGKNSDGTDAAGVTPDNITNGFWGPQETYNAPGNERYFRMYHGDTDPEVGPLLLFWDVQDLNGTPLADSKTSIFLGTQQHSSSATRTTKSIAGGHCEHRFWKSGMDSVRTYAQLEAGKNEAFGGSPGGVPQTALAHCFRLNNTGISRGSEYIDAGSYSAAFHRNYCSLASRDLGYPYDITSQDPSGPIDHTVSASIVGQSTIYDFYGRPFGVDGNGNTVYREKLFTNERSINSQLDVNGDLNQLQADGLRIAVTDYYNGKTYLLPGLATINEDTEDGSDFYLSLSGTFICNSGQDVVFSNYYLVENDPLYEVDPANNLPSVSYYLSANQGPSHYVGSETGNIFIGVTLD